jgi:CRISPR-associated exonuclease Cas4
MRLTFLIIAVVLLVAAGLFFLIGWLNRRRSGLPGLRVVYADTGLWQRVEKPLYDPVAGLTGKPDYIVDLKGSWIPVEVKSGWAPSTPREAHILQLVAYCHLIERSQGKRPPYGLIHYKNTTFEVGYSQQLEQNLMAVIGEMRKCERTFPSRSHQEVNRCRACGYRDLCDQKL